MRFSKTAKRVLSLAVALAVVATSATVPQAAKKADAASSYNAYLCLATGKWTFRNNHDDSKFSSKLQNTTNKLSSKAKSAKFTNASMKTSKKGSTYTVKLTGLKKGVISNDKSFNTLYVDTTIPGTMAKKVTFSNVSVKFDGKTVKTFKKGITTPDPGKTNGFVQLQIINTWNNRVPKFKYSMPKSSIEVTYTIKVK
ncbi:MAG: hypothetical protein J5979_01490 [Lachnospiraceae bacterium]|nr:hypothetical protein [Lachnospiraceae bacterium]